MLPTSFKSSTSSSPILPALSILSILSILSSLPTQPHDIRNGGHLILCQNSHPALQCFDRLHFLGQLRHCKIPFKPQPLRVFELFLFHFDRHQFVHFPPWHHHPTTTPTPSATGTTGTARGRRPFQTTLLFHTTTAVGVVGVAVATVVVGTVVVVTVVTVVVVVATVPAQSSRGFRSLLPPRPALLFFLHVHGTRRTPAATLSPTLSATLSPTFSATLSSHVPLLLLSSSWIRSMIRSIRVVPSWFLSGSFLTRACSCVVLALALPDFSPHRHVVVVDAGDFRTQRTDVGVVRRARRQTVALPRLYRLPVLVFHRNLRLRCRRCRFRRFRRVLRVRLVGPRVKMVPHRRPCLADGWLGRVAKRGGGQRHGTRDWRTVGRPQHGGATAGAFCFLTCEFHVGPWWRGARP